MVNLRKLSWRQVAIYLLALGWMLVAHPQDTPGIWIGCGVGLVALGELLRIWATGHIHKSAVLAVNGPYRHVRNPMYLGSLLIGSGLFLAGGDLGLLAAFLVIFFILYMPRKERREGRRLLERFGTAYADYLVSVNSLVPRLRPYESQAPVERFRWSQCVANDEHGIALLVMVGVAILLAKLLWNAPWMALPPWVPPWL